MHNIEILVVDADSTDGTYEFIQQRMQEDSRIRLLHDDQHSTGYSNNLGVQEARGEYIAFCEADDYYEHNMLECLYRAAQEHGYPDVVKSDWINFIYTSQGEIELPYGILPAQNRNLYNREISLATLPAILQRDCNLWNGIYRRNFLIEQDIRHNESKGASFQDAGFIIQVHLLAKSEVYLRSISYHYRRDNAGSSTYNRNTALYVMQEMRFIMEFLNNHPDLKQKYSALVFNRLFNSFSNWYGDNIYWIGESSCEEYLNSFREEIKSFMQPMDESWKTKLLENDRFMAFLKSDMEYRKLIDLPVWRGMDKQRRFAEFLLKQTQVVIYGAGEMGKSMAALLIRNKFSGEICFCDDDHSIVGKQPMLCWIYAPADVVKKYPNAVYLLPSPGKRGTMRKRLRELGVSNDLIVDTPNVGPGAAMSLDWSALERRMSNIS